MEICKAPTLWLKALNKHMHIMYTEIENVIKKKKKGEKISTWVFNCDVEYVSQWQIKKERLFLAIMPHISHLPV